MGKKVWIFFYAAVLFNCLIASEVSHFLTFIMPCYNCEDTVIESLDSILKQKLKIPFEVICTDDASSDSTKFLLIEYAQEHSVVKVFAHQKNRGGGAARNTCIKHARGDLIFCLDSDNVLVPHSVQKLIDLLDQTESDSAVFGEIRYFRGHFNHTHSWFYQSKNNIVDIHHMLATHITPAASGNYLFTKKSYIRAGGYPEVVLDTTGFGFRQLATGSKIAILPKSFYWHRLSDSSYYNRGLKSGLLNYYEIFKEFPELYTAESYEYLFECEKQGKEFYEELSRFELVNDTALQHLFKAYSFVEKNDRASAHNEFEAAIEAGAVAEHVHKRMKHVFDDQKFVI